MFFVPRKKVKCKKCSLKKMLGCFSDIESNEYMVFPGKQQIVVRIRFYKWKCECGQENSHKVVVIDFIRGKRQQLLEQASGCSRERVNAQEIIEDFSMLQKTHKIDGVHETSF